MAVQQCQFEQVRIIRAHHAAVTCGQVLAVADAECAEMAPRNHLLALASVTTSWASTTAGPGVAAIRLAGFAAIGFAGGNIEQSGTNALCGYYCHTFDEVLQIII